MPDQRLIQREKKSRDVSYTIDHDNDNFVHTYVYPSPDLPIHMLASYVLALEVEVMAQQPVNEHNNLEEWYERRLSWVVEFMRITKISLQHLRKGVQDRRRHEWPFYLDSGTKDFMISHFIDSRARYLARRLT